MSQKVTAGRDNLGELAPQFAALNDDVLFGEVWAREAELSPRDRSLATVSALIRAGRGNHSAWLLHWLAESLGGIPVVERSAGRGRVAIQTDKIN